ncbi:MAG: Uma2 family endonuclease [Planctomycetota bacterium]
MRADPPKTVADYMALPIEWGVELIDGVFYDVTPAPGARHQRAALRLAAFLEGRVRRRKLGEVFISPFDVVLSKRTVVQPDVVFIAKAHLDRLKERLEGAPDIAIEFLSKAHREHDLKRKKDLYLRHKLPEYWIGDPDLGTIEILERAGGRWISRGVFGADGILRSPLLPGIAIPLSAVFGESP